MKDIEAMRERQRKELETAEEENRFEGKLGFTPKFLSIYEHGGEKVYMVTVNALGEIGAVINAVPPVKQIEIEGATRKFGMVPLDVRTHNYPKDPNDGITVYYIAECGTVRISFETPCMYGKDMLDGFTRTLRKMSGSERSTYAAGMRDEDFSSVRVSALKPDCECAEFYGGYYAAMDCGWVERFASMAGVETALPEC